MLSTKPIHLWKYLGLKKTIIPKGIKRLFYLSFEDALWDLLEKKSIKKGSVILVPEFYCPDVEENIKNHGFKVAYYPVDSELTTSQKMLTEAINKYNPKVVIILHPAGIINQLFSKNYWAKKLYNDLILIEDSVHLIVEPKKIRFLKPNHFVIDSLRKVIPLQGSNLYGKREDLDFEAPPIYQSLWYSIEVHALWFMMNLYRNLGLENKAEKTMQKGYDLIGDSIKPAPGFFIFDILSRHIDIEKVKKIKCNQIEFYEKKLKKLTGFVRIPSYEKKSKGELIGYPLILDNNKAERIIGILRSKGVLVRAELEGNVWSRGQKMIYLPLGPYLNNDDLEYVTDICRKIF